MARYDYHTQRQGVLMSAWVTDTRDANLVVRGPKRFFSVRRAKRWAADERHSLETEAWQRWMESVFAERQAA